MTSSIIPTIHLTRIYNLLLDTYGEPKNDPDYNPLGGLISTILSQHTSDINSGRAYRKLRATFDTWEKVRDAPTDQVAEAIRSGGLANIKAPRIQDALAMLTEQQHEQGGSKELADYLSDELARLSPEEGWKYLQRIPGVGPKTAACVLMFNLNQPVLPLDTHVFRTAQRLGMIGPRVTVNQAHLLFARVTPADWVYPLHVNLITHGRLICHAQRPKCSACPLYHECAYVGNVNVQETAIASL